MITERQEKILKFIVQQYTLNVQPIGSKSILEAPFLNISSATIRNECLNLEQKGYLEKVHESSGRIPTTKGYRYYVEHLMDVKDIDHLKIKIESLFDNRNLSINEILDETGKIISEMKKVTTLVVGPNVEEELLYKIEILPISESKAVCIFVLSNGHVENQIFNLDNISLKDLQLSMKLFNERIANTKISELTEKFKALKPILSEQVKTSEQILKKFLQALSVISKPAYSTYGMGYMLQNPEYKNSDKIKQIINFIESISPFDYYHHYNQKSNTKETSVPIVLKMGSELKQELDDIAMLSTTYSIGEASEGSIALVGPKRMEYNELFEVLKWLNKKIKEKNEKDFYLKGGS